MRLATPARPPFLMQLLWQPYAYLWAQWGASSNITEPPRAVNGSALPGFNEPHSHAFDAVNPLLGNGGDTPNGSGGMIPSVAPPFGMTRWVAQTRQNYVSVTPYNHTDSVIHGFQGTHQPAIWMGESGQVVVMPGTGDVTTTFESRGLHFNKQDEKISPSYYSVLLNRPEDDSEFARSGIFCEMSATSRVGHLRFTFASESEPFILLEATRASVMGSSDTSNVTYPSGSITISPSSLEIYGHNPERQDFIIGPNVAPSFAGYFVARFDRPFMAWGTAMNGTLYEGDLARNGTQLSGFVRFAEATSVVNVRVGVSFISIQQARRNLDREVPDGQFLEETAFETRSAWIEKLEMLNIEGDGVTQQNRTTVYSAMFHALQYPSVQSEVVSESDLLMYYSGYDDKVHMGVSYTGYSIWDTFRAIWAWQILFVPDLIPGMVTSMLQDFVEGGWLPMWKNIVETNIMVGTHADSLIAEAVVKGFGHSFDIGVAYDAVRKDATVPPDGDWSIQYADREENVGYEVRAGLSSVYEEKGWVADDIHSESASRTLDYAYDDYALAILAARLSADSSLHRALSLSKVDLDDDASFFMSRSLGAYKSIFNNDTGFMRARFANGSWAGENDGWTEGDMWAYTFDAVHDVNGLIALKGGKEKFVQFLDNHFNGGHNDHTNEPSHHIPYLYALAGAASKGQERIKSIATTDYNDTVDGLAGNEDCGQMSAWYLFSALGFYPVNPVSGVYVVGVPFFDKTTLHLPGAARPLVISAEGASTTKRYVKSLTVNGKIVDEPIIKHEDIAGGGEIVFGMSETPEAWASETIWRV